MSSYAITFYSRDDVTFGRDEDGNFTVTVNEGATPDTIKIVDNDKDGSDSFSGSTKAGHTEQEVYGESNGAEFDGDPIQPLAALPGLDDSSQQVMAIGIGDPVHTVGYGFTYEAEPGETVPFDYDSYIKEPSFEADDLYVDGDLDESHSDSETDEEGSGPSGKDDDEEGSGPSGKDDDEDGSGPFGEDDEEEGSGPSGKDDDEEGSGPSGKDDDEDGSGPFGEDDEEEGSGPSGKDDDEEGSGPSGEDDEEDGSGPSGKDDEEEGSGPSGKDDDEEGSGPSGEPSGGSEVSSPSGGSGASEPSHTSGPSGGSGSSGGSGPSGGGSGPSSPPCFTLGTAIRTARGEVMVEDLMAGDLVWTEAQGMQPIRWICQREVPATGAFAPIRICAGALGADRDILVSPAHRMLLQGPEIEVLFGIHKALVAAKDLVNDTTIMRDTSLQTVTYFHLMFDQHQVLEAHGTLSESFYPDQATIGDIDSAQRDELFALFPELALGHAQYNVAYPGLMPHEMMLIGRQVC